MKRAVFALLATAAGLVFVFTYRPASVIADPVPLTATADRPPAPLKPPKLAGKGLVSYDAGSGPGLDLAGLADGSYPGAVVEVPGGHGQLQVTITIAGGVVVDVVAAHQPTSTHSAQISGGALPLLREEVLTTQQVPVDAVSGATAVSQAFGESLVSAAGAR